MTVVQRNLTSVAGVSIADMFHQDERPARARARAVIALVIINFLLVLIVLILVIKIVQRMIRNTRYQKYTLDAMHREMEHSEKMRLKAKEKIAHAEGKAKKKEAGVEERDAMAVTSEVALPRSNAEAGTTAGPVSRLSRMNPFKKGYLPVKKSAGKTGSGSQPVTTRKQVRILEYSEDRYENLRASFKGPFFKGLTQKPQNQRKGSAVPSTSSKDAAVECRAGQPGPALPVDSHQSIVADPRQPGAGLRILPAGRDILAAPPGGETSSQAAGTSTMRRPGAAHGASGGEQKTSLGYGQGQGAYI